MKNKTLKFHLSLLSLVITLFLLTSPAYSQEEEFYTSQVIRVIDGDTIELKYGEQVRLIGIDCPEINTEAGKQVKEYLLKDIGILYRNVILQFGEEKYDKFGRLQAYISFDLKQNKEDHSDEIERYFYYDEYGYLFLNATLINAGYARAVIKAPNIKYKSLFRDLYKEAKENNRGFWKKGQADLRMP